jgi:hypothetical protein
MAGSTNIRIDGVKQTVAFLKDFAPEIQKAMNKTIRLALNDTKRGAEARYPKGAWSVNINSKKILGSISARSGGTRASSWADSSPGIKAAVFEFAGSRQPGRTPQARAMIASLRARYGEPGRFLWDAWDEGGKDALDKIETAVKQAERELQAKLDSMGESY